MFRFAHIAQSVESVALSMITPDSSISDDCITHVFSAFGMRHFSTLSLLRLRHETQSSFSQTA